MLALPMHNAWIRSVCENTSEVADAEGSEQESFSFDDRVVKTGVLVFHSSILQRSDRVILHGDERASSLPYVAPYHRVVQRVVDESKPASCEMSRPSGLTIILRMA